MHRSAAKSRADKRGRTPSVQAPPPPAEEVETEDLRSGCSTKAKFTGLLIQEDADEIVGEIMDDLLSMVMAGCHKVHIKNQLEPFSEFWAKTFLTQMAEQQILCLDEGERPDEVAETEDSEPMPAILDTWAQGSVPVIKARPSPRPHITLQQEFNTDHVPMKMEPSVNQPGNLTTQQNSSPKQPQAKSSPRRPSPNKHSKIFTPQPPPSPPPPKTNRKKNHPANLLPEPVQSNFLPSLSCTAQKNNVEIERKNKRYSISSQVTDSLYLQKDSRPIPKLDPSCLPRHGISPQYEIVDAKPVSRRTSAQSKLEVRANRQHRRLGISMKPLTDSKDEQIRNETDRLKNLSISRHRKEDMISSGPLRLDKMDLAKGVSLLESQTVDINSIKFNSPAQSIGLRLMPNDAMLSVDQVTTGLSPYCLSSRVGQ